MNLYLAPLEGITGHIYRNALHQCFDGFDKYFIPFISPNQKGHFSTREKKDVMPEHNQGMEVIPQILTSDPEDFLLYRKDRLRRSFELKMPAGRRATQIDDLGIKKDKNLPHQILHQDRHHLENNPYPAGLPRSYGECPWK